VEGGDVVVVLVPLPVIQKCSLLEGVLNGGQGNEALAVLLRGGKGGHLQGIESYPGIPTGHEGQVLQGLLVYLHPIPPEAPLFVRQGPLHEGLNLQFGQGVEGEDTGAGKEWRDNLKGGVLGGGPDEGDGALLHMGEHGVLLGLVEAVELVHEEDGLLAGEAPPLLGLLHHPPQVGHPGADGAHWGEVSLGHSGDDKGQGGLPRARGAPEDKGG